MRTTLLLTAGLTAVAEVSAGLAEARRALAERQSSSSSPNAVQNWANDYATETFKQGTGGVFSVDWNNGPGAYIRDTRTSADN